jgi:tRNA threonylcarbamoyladenosine dehydratase
VTAATEGFEPATMADTTSAPDLERRFGGLRRLYGDEAYGRLRHLRVAVVGLGGVGSWAVEALARCGVAALTLIDLDHVAESNINRQVQALGRTVGQSKVEALRERIADIHPGCAVHGVEEFADADNWPALLPAPVDVVIDACDQVAAKLALAVWALGAAGAPGLVMVGAAGGKQLASGIETADLGEVTHDPLLASLRQRVRRHLQAQQGGARGGAKAMGLRCVFSREPVRQPAQPACAADARQPVDGGLNCHGYGSSVMVTAAFGMVAAQEAVRCGLQNNRPSSTAPESGL